MLRMLKSQRIDLPDGSILWRNIYHIRKDPLDAVRWVGFARINKMYSPVTATAPSWNSLEGKTWKTAS